MTELTTQSPVRAALPIKADESVRDTDDSV